MLDQYDDDPDAEFPLTGVPPAPSVTPGSAPPPPTSAAVADEETRGCLPLLLIAGALAFLSLFAVMICIIWALANVVAIWLAALITAVGFLVLAAICGLVGKTILQKVGPPIPETALGIAKGTPAELGIVPPLDDATTMQGEQ